MSFRVSYFHHFTFKPGIISNAKQINNVIKHNFILTLLGKNLNDVQLPTESYLYKITICQAKLTDTKKSAQYVPVDYSEYWEVMLSWPVEEED